jgi:hypothetical protein
MRQSFLTPFIWSIWIARGSFRQSEIPHSEHREASTPSRSSFAFLHQRDDFEFKTSDIDLAVLRGFSSPRRTARIQATWQNPNRTFHSLKEAPPS